MLFFVIFSNMVIVISDNFSPYSCFVLKKIICTFLGQQKT